MSEIDANKLENLENAQSNFIQKIVERDMEEGAYARNICTRFPPEPNGYLHIGSVYAINISHTIASKYQGHFNLRFDDTNPLKEDMEYVDSIIHDMKWMGYDPGERVFYGSDYSDQIYQYAVQLIKKEKAYVDDLTAQEIKEYRGTLTTPGKNSPYRDRSVEENLDLFERMKNGEFPSGAKILRAKIDMASPNMNMRDPAIYRIHHAHHYRTEDRWCIYPMYDFAHPLQDAIEGITHSLCSIEFRDHRPLYEWVLNTLDFVEPPKQREFGRLNLTGVITSKRYLRQLVFENHVDGWDDPRMVTIQGLRRRGFTPSSIKMFMDEIGVAKAETTVDISMLEHCLRADLKAKAAAVMAVLRPLKVVLTNYPDDLVEMLPMANNAENEDMGSREVPFSKVLYIEQEDFMETTVKGYNRLAPDVEVRLKGAYFIKCQEVIKNEEGEILELRCTYDPATKSGSGFEGRKVKGTIHWVSAAHGVLAEVHLYDKLLLEDDLLKDENKTWAEKLNPHSKIVLTGCMLEPCLKDAPLEGKYQFIRNGYFCVDMKYTAPDHLVFNRIVPLKDSWKGKNK
jgi:glutaminyl-tRNA synthetase